MTPNERKKILDWIEENSEKRYNSESTIDRYVNVGSLEAFIESLSTEEAEVLQEGDWFDGTMDQLDEVFSITGHSISGSFGQRKALVFKVGCIVSYRWEFAVNKLDAEEFIHRARNTFNNPKL